MRKHSVAISKRTHSPFDPTYVVTWRASPQQTHGHLLYQWVNLNSKMKRHTFSTEPKKGLPCIYPLVLQTPINIYQNWHICEQWACHSPIRQLRYLLCMFVSTVFGSCPYFVLTTNRLSTKGLSPLGHVPFI